MGLPAPIGFQLAPIKKGRFPVSGAAAAVDACSAPLRYAFRLVPSYVHVMKYHVLAFNVDVSFAFLNEGPFVCEHAFVRDPMVLFQKNWKFIELPDAAFVIGTCVEPVPPPASRAFTQKL